MGREGRDRKIEVEKGAIEGDQLSFTVPMTFGGTEVEIMFAGKIATDDIDGTVAVEFEGDKREFPWMPKRSVMDEDIVGEWQIHIEADDGSVFEPVLTISQSGDKLKSVYTTEQGTELEVEELKLEDNHLSFSVTVVPRAVAGGS